MSRVAVIGGGAAGMLASVFAARRGHEVHVYEKNEKLGKKLYITGKGRCNLTNACDMETLIAGVRSNPRFLYRAFYGFTNQDTMDFFREEGLELKVERGGRVFPGSDRSADVLDTLKRAMKRAGVRVHLNTGVSRVQACRPEGFLLTLKDGSEVPADKVIAATGGLSYPSTGSTGDGYRFAQELGLSLTECCPSLVPFNVEEDWVKKLQGLSLKNVSIRILDGRKELHRDFGEMLFTHFGVSGPLILTASSICARRLRERPLTLVLDLKPALSREQLEARILREFEQNPNKQFANVLPGFLPSKLTGVMYGLTGIPERKRIHEITREERRSFLGCMKELPMTVTGLRDYREAIITKGGVSVKEIDPATMEAKCVPGFYVIGEMLDLDAVTGGFNLQIAWSTAYAAGHAV